MLPGSIPGAGYLFNDVEVDSDTDIGKDREEIKQQLSKIGGWWGVVAKRWIDACEKPGHALSDLKRALLEDTISYGVVSAVMLTIAQAEMCLEDNEEAPVLLRAVKQVHENCWYLCFAANMLCLYLSTTEYLHTAATHPKDILVLLSKRYPPDFGKSPECNFQSWMRYLKVGKLDAFKRGFQMMVPGLLSGVYLRCDWHLTVGPLIISFLTCLLGYAMWRSEMKPPARRPSKERARPKRDDAEAFLHPSRNSRELCYSTIATGHPEVRTSLPPQLDSRPGSARFGLLSSSPSGSACGGDPLSPGRSTRSSRSCSATNSPRSSGPGSPRSPGRRSRGSSRHEVKASSSSTSCWSAGRSRRRSSRRSRRDSSRHSSDSRRPSVDGRDCSGAGRRPSWDERDGNSRPLPALAPPPEPRFPQSRRRFSDESPGVTFTYTG